MYNVINVTFQGDTKQYAYLYDDPIRIGDMLQSQKGSAKVVNVYKSHSDSINGKKLKYFNEMKETNSMFGGFVNKYKSQFIPQKENGVKMSIQGTIVVPVNGEYVGMDSDGNLISYDGSMCIDVPVYSINTPTEKVQIGDIVKNGNSFGKVLSKNPDGSLKILSFSGYTHNKKEIKDALLGQSMTRVLVNTFNFSGTGFNPIMFAMAEGDKFDVKSLVMLSMMPEGKNLFNGINPMMLMMLDNNGDSNNLMSMMMLSQMTQGTNPFMPQQPAENPVVSNSNLTVEGILSNPELVEKLKEALK